MKIKMTLLGFLAYLICLTTAYSCGSESHPHPIGKSELLGIWKVYSDKESIHLGGLVGRKSITIKLKPNGTAEYFLPIQKKWNRFGNWRLEGNCLSFPIGNSFVNFGNKLKYLGKKNNCLLFYDMNWKSNYRFCREQ